MLARSSLTSHWLSPFLQGSAASPLPVGVASSPARLWTPRRLFRRPCSPSLSVEHIRSSLVKRFVLAKPEEGLTPEKGMETEQSLDVLNHPILNFIYHMAAEILPSVLVLYILRKLHPKRISAQ